MNNRIIAIVSAILLGTVAPLSPAMAYQHRGAVERYAPVLPYDVETTGSVGTSYGYAAPFDRCPMSSAAEGNANQQNFPVKQYGQTSGGYRC